jgi:hypothetical protein
VFLVCKIAIDFMMAFLDDSEALVILVVLLRRMYNFLPQFRTQLHEPIMRVLYEVLKLFKQSKTEVSKQHLKDVAIRLYQSCQNFYDFIMDSEHTDQEFKDKINSKDILKFYAKDSNRGKFLAGQVSTSLKYILKPMKSTLVNCQIGFLRQLEVKAGEVEGIPVVIQKPNSILCINFETDAHDIQFGLMRASKTTEFADPNIHSLTSNSETCLETIVPLVLIDSANRKNKKPKGSKEEIIKTRSLGLGVVQITYNIKEPGFYMILFSNKFSWYDSKTVRFKYCILIPDHTSPSQTDTQDSQDLQTMFSNMVIKDLEETKQEERNLIDLGSKADDGLDFLDSDNK